MFVQIWRCERDGFPPKHSTKPSYCFYVAVITLPPGPLNDKCPASRGTPRNLCRKAAWDWCQLSKVPHLSKKNKVGFWSGTLYECSDALLEIGSSDGSIHGVCVCVCAWPAVTARGELRRFWLNRLSMYCRVAHVTLPFMNNALFIHCLYLFRPHDLKVTMHWRKNNCTYFAEYTSHKYITHLFLFMILTDYVGFQLFLLTPETHRWT